METSEKNDIGLAGELRVASELLKRGHRASVTFGNAKATDIVITGKKNRYVAVEVKTSKNRRNFVTGYYPKYTDDDHRHPDVWVFYLPQRNASDGDRFFILKHEEVGEMQLLVNKGVKTEKGKGCDNIPLAVLERGKDKYENRWELFKELLRD